MVFFKLKITGLKLAYWTGLITGIGITLVYMFQQGHREFMLLFPYVYWFLGLTVAVIVSIFALQRYWENLRSKLSEIWFSFTVGMILFYIGIIMFTIFSFLNIPLASVSPVDAFWFGGYVALLFGLYLYYQLLKPAITKRLHNIAVISVLALSVAVFTPLIFSVFESKKDPLTLIVNLAYPALDISIFFLALYELLVFTIGGLRGNLAKAWLLMTMGILLQVIGDMLLSISILKGVYYVGHPIELPGNLGIILITLAFYTHIKYL
jgi:hypothetical protein